MYHLHGDDALTSVGVLFYLFWLEIIHNVWESLFFIIAVDIFID